MTLKPLSGNDSSLPYRQITTKNKGTKEIKQNQTRRHRKKICDYQKIRGLGVHVMGEGGQLYGG